MAGGSNQLESLVMSLFGDNTQKEIAAENPYYQFQTVPSSVSQLAVELMKPTGYDDDSGEYIIKTPYSETLPWGIGAGLVQGVLQGLGDDYQSTLSDRYLDAIASSARGETPNVDLPNNLFRSATNQGKLFAMQREMQGKEDQKKRQEKIDDKLLDFGYIPQIDETGKRKYVKLQGIDIFSQAAEKAAAEETAKRRVGGEYIAGEGAATRQQPEAISADTLENGIASFMTKDGKGAILMNDGSVRSPESTPKQNIDMRSPQAKASRDIEDQANSNLKGSQLINNFGDVKTNFDTLKDLYQYNDRAATLAFISAFARVLDPASVVREGEIKNAENTQTFMSGLGYKLDSLVNGTQQIDEKVKQGMLRAAGAKYNNYGDAYSKAIQKEKARVSGRGGNSDNVFGPYDYEPFDFVSWYNSPARQQKTIAEEVADSPTADMKAKLEAIAEKVNRGVPLSETEKRFVYEVKQARGAAGVTGGW